MYIKRQAICAIALVEMEVEKTLNVDAIINEALQASQVIEAESVMFYLFSFFTEKRCSWN